MDRLQDFRPPLGRAFTSVVPVLAGVAMAVTLSGCDRSHQAEKAAASQDLDQAGGQLQAAARETGDAIKHGAAAADPEARKLNAQANAGIAKLASATDQAAHKAGHAIDKAATDVDTAAHRAADRTRDDAHN